MISPATIDEAVAAVRNAEAEGPMVCGAQTKIGGHSLPLCVQISTARMDRIVEYAPADMTMTVEAGARLSVVQEIAAKENLWWPVDAATYGGRATIGGVVATNDTGPMCQSLGSPRDHVLGMTIIMGDGSIVRSGGRVFKNVAGYALHRLMAGSWGEVAMIATVTLRLRPLAESLRIAVATAESERQLETWTAELLNGPTRPVLLSWRCEERLELIVGFADCREAVDWQMDRAAESMRDAHGESEAESRAVYESLRGWSEGAGRVVALPGSRGAELLTTARAAGVAMVVHGAGSRFVMRGTKLQSTLGERERELVAQLGGSVLVPRTKRGNVNGFDPMAELRRRLRRVGTE